MAEKSICECVKPQRELKMVECEKGWVKDVYCRKCALPIYK
jgi:hypothetical protein